MKNNRKDSYTHNIYNSQLFQPSQELSYRSKVDVNLYEPIKQADRESNYNSWTKSFRHKLNTLKSIRNSSSLNRTFQERESSYSRKLKLKISSMLANRDKETDKATKTTDRFFLHKKRHSNKPETEKRKTKLKAIEDKKLNFKNVCVYDLFEADDRPTTPNFKQIDKESEKVFLSEKTQESPTNKDALSRSTKREKLTNLSRGLEKYKSINSGRSICLYRGTRTK